MQSTNLFQIIPNKLVIPFSILPAIFFQILLTIVPTPLEHTFQAFIHCYENGYGKMNNSIFT